MVNKRNTLGRGLGSLLNVSEKKVEESIFGEIQINKYINRGGLFSKKEIYFHATVWWVINIPIGYVVYGFSIFIGLVQILLPLKNPPSFPKPVHLTNLKHILL